MKIKNKKITIILSIILLGLIIASSTYAYLNWSTDNTQKSNVVFTLESDFSCSADGGGNITPGDIELRPVNCVNSPEYVIKRKIDINNTIDKSGKKIYMDLWLNVNYIDSELTASDTLKYVLSTSGEGCNQGTIIASGSFYDDENGEEELGEEEMNLNYNGEYEGEMEGEEEAQEENMEEAQNDVEGEEMIENQEKGDINEQQGEEEIEQINNNEEAQNENLNDNGEIEKDIIDNNKENIEINNNNFNKEKKEEKVNNINNDININNNIKDKSKIQITNNINNKLSNLQRIGLINDKLNLNLNKIQKKQRPKKENVIENEIEKEQEFNNKIINRRKNDILSEILVKIQDFKQRKENFDIIRENNNSNKILDNLDKEITKGLEKLNNRSIIQDNKNIEISTTNKVEKKILRNPKFKEIVTMINDKEARKVKRYSGMGKNDLLNFVNNKKRNDIFGNINLFSQKKTSSNISNTLQNNTVKKYGPDSNKFYISCIDGKAIVNGMRKEIPIVSKFNNINEILAFKGENIYIPKEESKGGNYARNKGILASKGKYCAFLDDDDYWLPEKIEKQIALIKEQGCELVYCGRKMEDIINRGGGNLLVKLYNSAGSGELATKLLIELM